MPATVRNYTALLSGTSWWDSGPPRKPVFLTYSFETKPYGYLTEGGSTPYSRSFKPFTAAEKAAALGALKHWDDASGIVFLEAPAGQGDIRFGNYDLSLKTSTAGSAAYAYYPATMIGDGFAMSLDLGGDICMGTSAMNGSSSDMTHILAHEIGHAIGLKHPFEGDLVLDAAHDNTDYTVMSYTGYAPRLGAFDKQAVQWLYGSDADDGRQVASWSWNARSATLTQVGGGGGETIRGVASADVISGMGGRDRIFGSGGNDRIDGGDSRDILFGGDGDDTLSGGTGNDALHGGSGFANAGDGRDTADYAAARKSVTIDLAGWYEQSGGTTLALNAKGAEIGRDVFSSIENATGGRGDDTIRGDAKANVIKGGAGKDILEGGVGNDWLYGGLGRDTLTGGAGADRFHFDAGYGAYNLDTVTDFTPGRDKLVLDRDLFHGLTHLGSPYTVEFRTGNAARDANDRLIYDDETGTLAYDPDGSGARSQLKLAVLDPGLSLHASDFLIVA